MTWKNLSVCALVTLWALPVWATPSQMNVDGVLRDTGGNLVNADIGITFSLHGQTDGSDLLWQETQAVSVKNGVFSSKIPSDPASSPFPDGIFGGDSAYLQIQSAGQDALPMISLAFVPYAMHAKASASADKALALDCEACIETPMLSASVTIAASQVTYDDAANGLGATVQNALDGLFAQITGLTFADLVGGSDAVIAVIADDGFARLSDLAIVASTGLFDDLQGIPAGLSDGDNDTQLSSEQVLQMVSDGGISTGAHTVDTVRSDAEIQAVVGAHTVDTTRSDADILSVVGPHTIDTKLSSADVLTMVSTGGYVTGVHTTDTVRSDAEIQTVVGEHTVDTTRSDAEIQAVVGEHTADTDTQLSSEEVLQMVSDGGISTGAHTVDTTRTDAEIQAVVGAHTVDTDTHLSGVEVLGLVSLGGYVTGGHTVDTFRSDEEIQVVVGAHTVDTFRSDAEIQAVVGAHTVNTNTQLSSADVLGMVSNGGYVTGGHTTDTKLSEAEVDSFVSNNNYAASSHTHSYAASSHTHSYAASSHSHSYAASSHSHSYLSTGGGTLTGSLAMSSNKVTGLAAPTADADAATKAYVDAAAGGGGSSITTVKCNGSASGYDNPSCVASCPSGMKIIHSQVYCHFSNLGPQVTYVGEGMMSHDTWVYSCLKLPDSATTNVFRAYTPKANIGSYPTNKQVHGIIHCITAS